MATVLDSAKLIDEKDNSQMCKAVQNFRQMQHTPVKNVAKSLGVTPDTITNLEDGYVTDNKLLIREAHTVGMGHSHIAQIIADEVNKADEPKQKNNNDRPKKDNNTNSDTKHLTLKRYIHNLAKQRNLSLKLLCNKAGISSQYLSSNLDGKMYPHLFSRVAHAMDLSNDQIMNILQQHGVDLDGDDINSTLKRKRILAGFSAAQLARKANVSYTIIFHTEHNISTPSSSNLAKLEAVLNRSQYTDNPPVNPNKIPKAKVSAQTTDTPIDQTIKNHMGASEAPITKPSVQRITNQGIDQSLPIDKQTVSKLLKDINDLKRKINENAAKEQKDVKKAAQHVNLSHLGTWIEKEVHNAIHHYNLANINDDDMDFINNLHYLYQTKPQSKQLMNLIMNKLDDKSIGLLLSMAKTMTKAVTKK